MPVSFDFREPDRFTAGTVGEPGRRVFYLQAAEGPAVASLRLEKQQVTALADYLERVLADLRPDLLGSVTAFYDDGEFTEVAYFTDEASARSAERAEMPPELAEKFAEWESIMKVDRYLDIREPWLTASSH